MGIIKCPKCKFPGYLVRERGKYLRIVHNMGFGEYRRTQFCYLGEEQKFLRRLIALSRIYPEQNLDDVIDKIKIIIPYPEKEPNSEILAVIRELKRLYKRLPHLSDDTEHKIRREARCPYCSKRVAIYAKRIGRPAYHSYNEFWLSTWKHY